MLHRARVDKAKSREAGVGKAEVGFKKRVAEAQAWFHQAHKKMKGAQGQLADCELELVLKQADIKKAQEATKKEASKAEAARSQRQAELDSQEEDPHRP